MIWISLTQLSGDQLPVNLDTVWRIRESGSSDWTYITFADGSIVDVLEDPDQIWKKTKDAIFTISMIKPASYANLQKGMNVLRCVADAIILADERREQEIERIRWSVSTRP